MDLENGNFLKPVLLFVKKPMKQLGTPCISLCTQRGKANHSIWKTFMYSQITGGKVLGWPFSDMWLRWDAWVTILLIKKSYKTCLNCKAALKEDCQRLNFAVLNWNQPSIDFYKSLGAVDLTKEEGWHCFRLYRPQVERLAELGKKA